MSQQQAAVLDQGGPGNPKPLRPISATNSGFEHQGKERSGPASVPPGESTSRRVAVKKSNRTMLWVALAFVFAFGAAGLAWHKSRSQEPAGLPQPVDVGTVVPVPSHEVPVQGMPDPIAQAAPDAVAETASAASTALGGIKPVLKATVADVMDKIESIGSKVQDLLKGQKDHEDRLGQLEGEVTQLKQQLAQANAQRRTVSRPRIAPPRPAFQPTPLPVSQEESSRLLSVDVWNGQPSVAVGRSRAGANEVRFLTEGDSNGHATVKRADVGEQRAVIGTDKGDVVISRDQQ